MLWGSSGDDRSAYQRSAQKAPESRPRSRGSSSARPGRAGSCDDDLAGLDRRESSDASASTEWSDARGGADWDDEARRVGRGFALDLPDADTTPRVLQRSTSHRSIILRDDAGGQSSGAGEFDARSSLGSGRPRRRGPCLYGQFPAFNRIGHQRLGSGRGGSSTPTSM